MITATTTPLAFLGFAGQFPWTVVMVHIPILVPLLGGSLFAVSLSIAMGLAGNILRCSMMFWARSFSTYSRITTGAVCCVASAIGYTIMYVCFEENDEGVHFFGFWIGLIVALVGGMGTALVLSSGYGIASAASRDAPLANNVFFFGQAIAAMVSWPLKSALETIPRGAMSPDDSSILQLGLAMGIAAITAAAIIPVYKWKIHRKYVDIVPVEEDPEKTTATNSTAVPWKIILWKLIMPVSCIWVSFFATSMVSPGQLLRWPAFPDNSASFLSDERLHKSLCIYLLILAEAVGKSIPIIISMTGKPSLLQTFLQYRHTEHLIICVIVARCALVPLFVYPPTSPAGQFILIAVFGISQGVCSSLCLSIASKKVPQEQADIAGYINSFTIVNGQFAGSIAGMLLRLSQPS